MSEEEKKNTKNEPHMGHEEILRLIKENAELLEENNKLLRKIHKHFVYGVVFKFLWFAILIGLPFAIYFYVLEPYFEALGSNYEVFRQGVAEIPGLRGLEKILPQVD